MKQKLENIEEKEPEEDQTIDNIIEKQNEQEEVEEKQVRSYQRVFDKGTIDDFLLKGPQKVDPKDYSSACSLALFFVQDDDQVNDSVHRVPSSTPFTSRP